MADNIASIYIGVSLDTRELQKQLFELEKQKIKLSLDIDTSALKDLRKELTKPLDAKVKVRVDATELDDVYKKIEGLNRNVAIKLPLDVEMEPLQKGIEEAFKRVNLSGWNPFKQISTGFFENVGSSFSAQILKGLKTAGQDNFNADIEKLVANYTKKATKSAKGNVAKDLDLEDEPKKTIIRKRRAPGSPTIPVDFYTPPEIFIPQVNREKELVQVNREKELVEHLQTGRRIIAAAANKNFTRVITEIVKSVEQSIERETNSPTPNLDQTKAEFSKLKARFKEAYAQIETDLTQGNTERAKAYAQTIITNAARANADIDNVIKKLADSGLNKNFGSNLSQLHGSTKGILTARYVNPSKRVLSKIENEEQINQGVTVGKDVLAGFVHGLKDKSAIVRESSDVALIVLNTMRRQLGIQSPSKKAFAIAQAIGAGMANGLNSSVNIVKQAGQNLAAAALPIKSAIKQPIERAIQEARQNINKAAPNLLPKTFGENKKLLQEQQALVPKNLMHAPLLGFAPGSDKGTVKYWEALLDRYAKFPLSSFEKAFGGKEEGKSIAKEAGAFIAMNVAGATRNVMMAPLALPLVPTIMGANMGRRMLTPVIEHLMSVIDDITSVQLKMSNLAGSEAGGIKELDYVKNVSSKYATNLQSGAGQYASLGFATKGTKLEGEDTKKLFEGISAANKYVGATAGESSLIFQAFVQMVAKGKISMEELRQQLSEKFPPAMNVFAKALGVSVPDLTTLIQRGSLLAEDVLPKVADVLIKDFGNATASGAASFVTAMNRMQNASFTFSTNLTDAFGGAITSVINIGAGLFENVNSQFANLNKVFTLVLMTLAAQSAAAFQVILGHGTVAKHLNTYQNLLLATFKKTFSMMTPFLAGTFIDLFDDIFGAKHSTIENMFNGVTNAIVAMFAALDNITRGFTGKGMFSVQLDTKDVDKFKEFTNFVGGFFKILPSGVVEMAALVLMLQQIGLLAGAYVVPSLRNISATIGTMITGIKDSVLNAGNLKDSMKAFFPFVMAGAKNVAGVFTGLAANALVALGIMALAQSDFGNPLEAGFNDAARGIKDNLKQIGEGISGLGDISAKTGEIITDSLTLKSQGLELNPLKILGIAPEKDSFKTDDFIKMVNSGNNTKEEQEIADANKAKAESLGLGRYVSKNDIWLTTAQKNLLNSAQDIANQGESLQKAMQNLNLSPDKIDTFLNSADLKFTITSLEQIDQQMKQIGSQRADLGIENSSASKAKIKDLDDELETLLKKRKALVKPLENVLGNVDDLKASLEAQQKLIEDSKLPRSAKIALKQLIDPQKAAIEETVKIFKEAKLTDLIKPLENVWTRVVDKLKDVDLAFNKLKDTLKVQETQQAANILNNPIATEATKKRLTDRSSIQYQTENRNNLSAALQFRQNSLRELLTIQNAEGTDTRKKEIQELRDQIKKDTSELAESDLKLAQSKQALLKESIDQTRQVYDYYRNIARASQETEVDISKLSLQNQNQATINSLRSALAGGYDTIMGTLVSSIEEALNSVTSASDKALDAQKELLTTNFNIEDATRSGLELAKSIPIENQIEEMLNAQTLASQTFVTSISDLSKSFVDLLSGATERAQKAQDAIAKNQAAILKAREEEQRQDLLLQRELAADKKMPDAWQQMKENWTNANKFVGEKSKPLGVAVSNKWNEAVNQGENLKLRTMSWWDDANKDVGARSRNLGFAVAKQWEQVKAKTSEGVKATTNNIVQWWDNANIRVGAKSKILEKFVVKQAENIKGSFEAGKQQVADNFKAEWGQNVKQIQEGFEKKRKDLSAKAQYGVNQISSFANYITNELTSGIKALADDKTEKPVEKFGKYVWKELKDGIKGLADDKTEKPVEKFVKYVGDELVSGIKGLADDKTEKPVEKFVKYLGDELTTGIKTLTTNTPKQQQAQDKFVQDTKKGLDTLLQGITKNKDVDSKDIYAPILKSINDKWDEVGKTITANTDFLSEGFNSAWQSSVDGFNKGLKVIEDSWKNTTQGIENSWTSAIESIGKLWSNGLKSMSDAMSFFGTNLKDAWDDTLKDLDHNWTQAIQNLEANWKLTNENLVVWWQETTTNLNSWWQELGVNLKDTWVFFLDGLSSSWGITINEIQQSWKNTTDSMTLWWQQTTQTIVTWWAETGNNIKETTTFITDGFLTAWTTTVKEVEKVWVGITESITTTWNKTVDGLATKLQEFGNYWGQIMGQVSATWEQSPLVQGANKAISYGQNVLSEIDSYRTPQSPLAKGAIGLAESFLQQPQATGVGFVSPIKGKTVQDLLNYQPSKAQGFYGIRDGGKRQHSKIDFDSRVGAGQGAEVLAAMSGIAKARALTGNSAGLDITSTDTKGNRITVVYNHLAVRELTSKFPIGKDVPVKAGDRLSTVTNDALSSGAHLDFGIKVNGQYVDPQKWIASEGQALQRMQNIANSVLPPVSKQGLQSASPNVLLQNSKANFDNNLPVGVGVGARSLPPGLDNGLFNNLGAGNSGSGNILWGKAANFAPSDLSGLTARGKKALELLKNPNIRAVLDSIAVAELGADAAAKGGYGYLFGDVEGKETFDANQLTRHPKRVVHKWGHSSSATGRYQTMDFVWDEEQGRLGLRDFKPQSQEIMAVSRLMYRKVVDDILSGNIAGAIAKPGSFDLSGEWASLEGNPYGQGTGGGKRSTFLANVMANARQAGNARQAATLVNQPIQNAALNNQAVPSAQLQLGIKTATDLAVENSTAKLAQQQENARLQQERDLISAETALNRVKRQNERLLRETQDSSVNRARTLTDNAFEAIPFPTIDQQNKKQSTEIQRKKEDAIKQFTRDLEDAKRVVEEASKFIAQSESALSTEADVTRKNILTVGIEETKKLRDIKLKEVADLQKKMEETAKIFDKQEESRYQKATFEEYLRSSKAAIQIQAEETGVIQEKVNVLERIRELTPTDSRLEELPALRKKLALNQLEIDTSSKLLDIEEKIKKSGDDPKIRSEYIKQLEALQDQNDAKVKAVELTYQQLVAEQQRAKILREISIKSKFGEINNQLLDSQIKNQQRIDSKNAFSVNTQEIEKARNLFAESQKIITNLQLEKDIQDIRDFAKENGLTVDQVNNLIQSFTDLNKLKLTDIKNELNDTISQDKISALQKVRENLKTNFDMFKQPGLDLLNARADKYENIGGNQFVANAMRRSAAKEQELFNRDQSLRSVDEEVLQARLKGIEITDSQVAELKNNIIQLSEIKLDNLNFQFKNVATTLGDIAKQGLTQFSQGIADLITKGGSLSDVFDSLFSNILNSVINMGLQSLLGGMLGGGGFLGSLFYTGQVPKNYAKGGIHAAMTKERMMSGRKPELAIVHENELIIPAARAEQLAKAGLSPEMLLGRNYANGQLPKGILTPKSQQAEITVKTQVINNVEYVTLDQLQKGMREAAKRGASEGANTVQMRMQNSSSFRSAVGI